MIEVSVAYGEQKRLILPDSSEVWLNAGSSILYPETFAKDKRQVILNGEAYFSVKKDTVSSFYCRNLPTFCESAWNQIQRESLS